MPEARVIQQVTNGGEIGPEFYARTDVVKYQTSLARARNLVLLAGGGSSNRAGLEFLQFSNDENYRTVFIEFETEDGLSYMLEFSHFEMRIFQEGAIEVYPPAHALAGQIVVIATPYSAERAQAMDYSQSNDVITITTGDDPVYELRRLNNYTWQFAQQSFASPTNIPTGVSVIATTGYSDATATDPYVADHTYAVTATLDDGRETVLSASDTASNRMGWPQNYNTVAWTAPVGVVVSQYGVYKKRNSLWGLVGFTTELTFKDDNIAPDWSYGPPNSKAPFNGSDKRPNTIAYFQQRRVFGGTAAQPFTLFGTRSARLSDMGVSDPQRDDDAFTIPGSGTRRQTILSLVPIADLLVFTKSGEWLVAGDSEVVTYKSYLKIVSNYGSEKIKPIVAGSRILMIQQLGKIVRDIAYSFESQGYAEGEDRSVFVQHLFKTRKITCWSYREEDGVIWVGCDDGAFFTFTYILVQDIWGWSMQTTAGRIEAIKAVREVGETGVYFAARRFLNGEWRRTIERLHTRNFTTVKDAFFVDCGISYDQPIAVGDISIDDGIVIDLPDVFSNGDQIDVQLPGLVDADGAPFDSVCYAQVTDHGVRLLDANGDPIATDGLIVQESGGEVRIMVDHLSNLDHLANMPVSVLADGAVISGAVVSSSGALQLPAKAGRMHVGLPYFAEWETLELKKGTTTTEGIIQSVEEVSIEVANSRGFQVGPTFDQLREPPPRDDGDDYGPLGLVDGVFTLTMDAEWGNRGHVCVRQADPLPATLLAIIPNVVYQGE